MHKGTVSFIAFCVFVLALSVCIIVEPFRKEESAWSRGAMFLSLILGIVTAGAVVCYASTIEALVEWLKPIELWELAVATICAVLPPIRLLVYFFKERNDGKADSGYPRILLFGCFPLVFISLILLWFGLEDARKHHLQEIEVVDDEWVETPAPTSPPQVQTVPPQTPSTQQQQLPSSVPPDLHLDVQF